MQNIEAETLLQNIPKEKLGELILQALQKQAESQTERITIPELCLKHHQHIISRELATGTITNYNAAYRIFQKWAENRGLIYADEVKIDHTEEFYIYMLKTPAIYTQNKFRKENKSEISRTTAINRYALVKAVFGYALKRDYIGKNPFPNKAIPQTQVTEWWDDEYYHKLINAIRTYAKPSNKTLTELLTSLIHYTGIRIGILLRTRRRDINIRDNEVYVTLDLKINKSAARTRETIRILHEKTKEKLTKYVRDLDAKGIHPDDYVFHKSEPRTKYTNFRKTLRTICIKAEIQYLSPHKAKHGFVTRLANAGFTAEQICKLTTNRTPSLIRTTYMHLFHEDVANMAYKLLNE